MSGKNLKTKFQFKIKAMKLLWVCLSQCQVREGFNNYVTAMCVRERVLRFRILNASFCKELIDLFHL
jgi:hypothetical protein